MITEYDLDAAIAECQGERNPNSNTCMKLAAFLIIKRELFGTEPTEEEKPTYSYLPPVVQAGDTIQYSGDSEFSKAIAGRESAEIWTIMDELMSTLEVLYPRLYSGVMRKIEE